MEREVSFFRSLGSIGQVKSLSEVFDLIKMGEYKNDIERLRDLKINSDKFGKQKSKLHHFTPSGIFDRYRKAKRLVRYNGIVMLDIDSIGKNTDAIRNKSAADDYTLACFISPSGEGVKIFVKTDAKQENHEMYFESIADYYEKIIDMEVDRSGKDISRTCIVSHDPELFHNENAAVFSVVDVTEGVTFSTTNMTTHVENIYEKIVDFTRNIDTYRSGNRNNFIFKLANNLNRAGIEKNTAETFLTANFTDQDIQIEIPNIVKSAYSNTSEFGKFDFKYFASVSSASFATAENVKETPVIPQVVYSRLPVFLSDCISVFRSNRERDMFLTGALSNLSGCFNNVEGNYDGRLFSPNLFSFIIAPPASGKGVVNFCRQLLSALNDALNKNSEGVLSVAGDVSRKVRGIFIPADSSSAAIKRMLIANDEQGVICETEADTLSSTLAQDWGGFDDLLRKAFHHEPVSFSRVDKDSDDFKLREIKRPRLAVCLTGTPSQVPILIKSTENGLFSRFIFYTFQNNTIPEFKDVFANDDEVNLEEFFEEKAKIMHEMYQKASRVEKCRFSFSKEQKLIFKNEFDKRVKEMHYKYGEETQGVVFRLGLIAFRIAMLLTILRTLESSIFSESIECCDDDFEASIELSHIYLHHSMTVFQSLPGSKRINQNAMTLLSYLPAEFSFTQAEQIGLAFCDIKSRSISNYLKELVANKLLAQPKENGLYYK
tara:strand:+ start:2856 stop:5003 length:2148 start_codon:yes stop_codon:yes gene_type:complete